MLPTDKNEAIRDALKIALGAGVGIGAGYAVNQLNKEQDQSVGLDVDRNRLVAGGLLGVLGGGAIALAQAKKLKGMPPAQYRQLTLDDARMESLLDTESPLGLRERRRVEKVKLPTDFGL